MMKTQAANSLQRKPHDEAGIQDKVPQDISAAVRTTLNVLALWDLDQAQQCAMLGISVRSWFGWKKAQPRTVSGSTLERISYILGIWKALRQLFPDHEGYRRWPHLPNNAPMFAGQPPIRRMSAGHVADLYAVREWLDGWRGW
jgi:hypothetical protein